MADTIPTMAGGVQFWRKYFLRNNAIILVYRQLRGFTQGGVQQGCKSQAWQIKLAKFKLTGPGRAVQARNFCGPGRFLPIFRENFAIFWKNDA